MIKVYAFAPPNSVKVPIALEELGLPHVVDTVGANRGRPGLRYLDRFNTSLPW